MNVAISADGNTVALGMPNYFHEEFDYKSGEVFVFHFNGTSWARSRLLSGSRREFGRWVGINDAGDTLAVATGDNTDPPVPDSVDIYELTSGAWQPVRSIRARPGHAESCANQAVLSRDGSTVAQNCFESATATAPARNFVRTHSGPNWTVLADLPLQLAASSDYGYGTFGLAVDATGDTVAAQIFVFNGPFPNMGPSQVHVFKRNAGVYSKVAELSPGAWRVDGQKNFYGNSLAVSGDGSTIAVGDTWDNGTGTGPRAAPLNPDANGARTGAVYVYRLAGSWRLANMVKPNRSTGFGAEVALNGNGHTLIVGDPGDSSNATGIGGDWNNNNGGANGAVWMY
jgi:hypothetical protein